MKKLLSLILALAIFFCNGIVPINASNEKTQQNIPHTGDLEILISFIVPENKDNFDDKKISFELSSNLMEGSNKIVITKEILNSSNPTLVKVGESNYNATIVAQNEFGVEITNEQEISIISIKIKDLPQGEYAVQFNGNGYQSYTTKQMISIKNYSQKVVIFTNDGRFTIGDVNGDSTINNIDLKLVEQNLSKPVDNTNNTADLNSDGQIDITDIALVNRHINLNEFQGTEVYSTNLINTNIIDVNTAKEEIDKLKDSENTILSSGNIKDILSGSDNPIKLEKTNNESISSSNFLTIPVPIISGQNVEIEQINIVTPSNLEITEGFVTVVDTNENQIKVPFSKSSSLGIDMLTKDGSNSNVVTISLGKKVAVKKVTITVTAVEDDKGNTDYVSVEQIEFIKDIVPENPKTDNGVVKDIEAKGKNSEVLLTWDVVPNITGYRVYISDLNTNDLSKFSLAAEVNTNKASITHFKGEELENLEKYYFYIESTNGEWLSNPSKIVSAIPQPSKVPLRPDNVTVTSGFESLNISWSILKDAETYNVYYKKASDNTFIKSNNKPITSTNYTISNLEAQIEYILYVEGVNIIGTGPKSIEAVGTPYSIDYIDPGMPTYNKINNNRIIDIELMDKNNVVHYPNGFDINNVIDGDFATHYIAKSWQLSTAIEYTFDSPIEMDHFALTANLNPVYNKSLRDYSVRIWTDQDDINAKPSYELNSRMKHFINEDGVQYYVGEFEKSNVKKISVHIGIWEGAPSNASISEIQFYEYYSLLDDINALFADNTFTKLAEGVTQAQIDSIYLQLEDDKKYFVDVSIIKGELELASSLLSGDTSKIKYVKEDIDSVQGLQQLDINAVAGSTVAIYADIPVGETMKVIPTQYFAEHNAFKGAPITLQNGRNIITIPNISSLSTQKGGPLYLTYEGTQAENAKLHINNYDGKTGTNSNIFYSPSLNVYGLDLVDDELIIKEEIRNYINELTNYITYIGVNESNRQTLISNNTELSFNEVLLSLPADQILQGILDSGLGIESQVEALYNNLFAWEEFMHLMLTVNGVNETQFANEERENIRYMRMFGKAFMYAAGNHIGIGFGSAKPLVMGEPTSVTGANNPNNLFGWAVAHEVGHNKDTIGHVEVTNNIYSLYAQVRDGNRNDLNGRVSYDGVYEKVSKQLLGKSNSVSIQLGMYWQLALAYESAQMSQEDYFYYQYNKNLKEGQRTEIVGEDNRFAVRASDIMGTNLTEFFVRWGFDLSKQAKEEMNKLPQETRAIHYFNDESRRLRLDETEDIADVNIYGESVKIDKNSLGNEVTLTWSSDDNASILGYEIHKNGESIGFAKATNQNEIVYTDNLGNANNLAYEYSIIPISKQGKVFEKMILGQIKISYDSVIDKSLYEVSQSGSDTILTFESPKTASGIRFTNYASQVGSLDVIIKTLDNDNNIQEYPMTFNYEDNQSEGDKYISYFNKPYTVDTDTRIWNYDIKEIIIKDAPVDANNIDLIAYTGDNITMNSYAIGTLKNDLVFDETAGKDGIIKAGTLIMTGDYISDPVYGIIKLVGEYDESNMSTGETNIVTRDISGYSLLFAEIPEDGEVSTISDGLWIFVPDIQNEDNLTGGHGDLHSILPTRIKAELYRTDNPDSSSSKYLTSNTEWILTPTEESMPEIIIE